MAATLGTAKGLTIANILHKPVRVSELRGILSNLIND
jgi:hypothetical protein